MAELNRTYISGGSQIEGNLEVNGNAVINGDLTADNLNATGAISGATIESTGAVQGASLSISGASSLNTLSSSGKSTLNSLEVTTNETIKGNLTVNGSISCADLFLKIYPIGSIYMSVNSINPSTLFGGTWVAWGQGKVPVGVSSDTEFNTVEKTGGEKVHTLTINEIPSHYGHVPTISEFHIGNVAKYLDTGKLTAYGSSGRGWNICNGNEIIPAGNYIGGGSSHNNLQPYITCYMWKRTA